MTHSLYEVNDEPDHAHYRFLHEGVGLTSRTGTIASFVLDERRGAEPAWRMEEHDLLRPLGVCPDSHAIVVDLKPESAKNLVNLFRMRGIVGYSYRDWTPVCFLLEELVDNMKANDPNGFKGKFTLQKASQEKRAVSPVYLRAGLERIKGTAWGWGSTGWVNGPMLWPDAWRHFNQEIESSNWFD